MLGLAVIGAGNWGRNLIRNFVSFPEVDLRCICDLDERVRQAMAVQYPSVAVVPDLRQALADHDVQAVVVAVDAPRHHEVARACLEAGMHTYVEKPLALSTQQAAELLALAEREGLKLMVGHLMEYHPAVQYMKEVIAQRDIGHPLYLTCQRVNLGIVRRAENAWWSLAPHDVAMACYLFDAEPASVSASGQAYLQKGVEDVVFANLKFADGRMAHLHVSWLDPHKIRKVTLVASRKMVVFDDMSASEKIRVYDKAAEVQPHSVVSYVDAITLRTGDILIPKISSAEPLKLECRHFVDCVQKNLKPLSDGADGLRVVRVLEAGAISLAKGGEPVAPGASAGAARP